MTKKILINAKHVPLNDYFTYGSQAFCYLGTTDNFADIRAHFEVFEPDAYLCGLEPSDDEVIGQLRSISEDPGFKHPPLVVTGSAEAVADFEQKAPELSALKIIMPSTIASIEKEITAYLSRMSKADPNDPSALSAQSSAAVNPLGMSPDDMDALFDELMAEFNEIPVKKIILIIDDDRSVLKMLKTALCDDYDVTTMINGKMLERFLAIKTPDLVILDYEMPIENGVEVFKRLKAIKKAKNIPVLFLTGVSDSEVIKDVLALSPDGYMLKPIDIQRLLETMKRILGS